MVPYIKVPVYYGVYCTGTASETYTSPTDSCVEYVVVRYSIEIVQEDSKEFDDDGFWHPPYSWFNFAILHVIPNQPFIEQYCLTNIKPRAPPNYYNDIVFNFKCTKGTLQ